MYYCIMYLKLLSLTPYRDYGLCNQHYSVMLLAQQVVTEHSTTALQHLYALAALSDSDVYVRAVVRGQNVS